jgi:hypothetical protein
MPALWCRVTSPARQAERAARAEEQLIFDGLPAGVRLAMNECPEQPPRPSTVRDALLRGITEDQIIQLIMRKAQPNA